MSIQDLILPLAHGGLGAAATAALVAVRHLVARSQRAAEKADEVDEATARVRVRAIEDTAEDRRQLWDEIASLRQEVRDLRAKLEEVLEDRHKIRAERDAMRLSNEALTQRLREEVEARASTEAEAAELASRVRALTAENDELRRSLR